MKKIMRYAVTALIALVMTVGTAVSASAAEVCGENVRIFFYSVGNQDICSELNTIDLQSLLEKLGCNFDNASDDTVITPPDENEPEEETAPDITEPDIGNIPETSLPDNGSTEEPTQPDQNDGAENQTPDNDVTEENVQDSVSDYEKRVVLLVNEIRAQNGLAPLTLNRQLSVVARVKSQDMRDNQYFSHTSPVYGSPFDMMKGFGISYRTAGENIAMGYMTPEAVVNAWMNSDGHRANILNSSFTQIGVGHVADGNYWTQMFIG